MADPLSIAASVAGLAAVAGKVVKILYNFVSDLDDAPHLARSALDTVNETRLALEAIGHLIETIESVSAWRKTLIRLDHVGLTLSNCIMTLSELEALVSMDDDDDAGILQRIQWVRVEGKVERLLPRLESQKTSLSLMVTVLQWYVMSLDHLVHTMYSHTLCSSQSHFGAIRDCVKLQSTVDRISEQNQELARRMRHMETLYTHPNQSTVSASTFRPASRSSTRLLMGGRSITPSIITTSSESLPVRSTTATTSSDPTWTLEPREFELALESSWVYSRNASNELDRMSLRSSIARSSVWSILTGKSLGDISVLSVYRLPITLRDITQLGQGLTFERIFLHQQSISYGPIIHELEPEKEKKEDSDHHAEPERGVIFEDALLVEEGTPLPIEENAAGVAVTTSTTGKAVIKTSTTNVSWGNIPKRNVLSLK